MPTANMTSEQVYEMLEEIFAAINAHPASPNGKSEPAADQQA